MQVRTLQANEYVFLTLCAGTTLQPGDQVKAKSDIIERTLLELGDKVTEVGVEETVTKLKYSTFEIIKA